MCFWQLLAQAPSTVAATGGQWIRRCLEGRLAVPRTCRVAASRSQGAMCTEGKAAIAAAHLPRTPARTNHPFLNSQHPHILGLVFPRQQLLYGYPGKLGRDTRYPQPLFSAAFPDPKSTQTVGPSRRRRTKTLSEKHPKLCVQRLRARI